MPFTYEIRSAACVGRLAEFGDVSGFGDIERAELIAKSEHLGWTERDGSQSFVVGKAPGNGVTCGAGHSAVLSLSPRGTTCDEFHLPWLADNFSFDVIYLDAR